MKRTSEKIKATIDPGKVMVFIVFFKSQHTIYLFPKDVVQAQSLSHVQLFATLWTVALQAPLSMGFPK